MRAPRSSSRRATRSSGLSESEGQGDQAPAPREEGLDRLVEWIQAEEPPGADRPGPVLPPVHREPYSRTRHFDETGRWLAKALTLIFGSALLASFLAIALRLGNSSELDGWMRLAVPSLSGLTGAAAGFYFRGKIEDV